MFEMVQMADESPRYVFGDLADRTMSLSEYIATVRDFAYQRTSMVDANERCGLLEVHVFPICIFSYDLKKKSPRP